MFRKLRETRAGFVTLEVDGLPVRAEQGETVAAVLLRQAEPWSRLSPVSRSRRGPYCMMGACFDCLAEVDGKPGVQTCLTVVHEGMRVARQRTSRRVQP